MRVAILTTGGTIEKTYNESDGTLANVGPVLQCILGSLRHPGIEIRHVPVMSKDSLDIDDADRQTILYAVKAAVRQNDALVLVHGTDTLARTGEYLHANLPDNEKPIVLTGAMRPYEFRDTDAVQNVTEALLACRILEPGVWVVMHSCALRFPGVVKDRGQMTFVPADQKPA
ncbi:MAG: asparaginase [bacterium]|nr:asparaginase [bacterium]